MNVPMHDVDRMSSYCTGNELCELSWISQSLADFRFHEELQPGAFYFSNKNLKHDLTSSEKSVSLWCYTYALCKDLGRVH